MVFNPCYWFPYFSTAVLCMRLSSINRRWFYLVDLILITTDCLSINWPLCPVLHLGCHQDNLARGEDRQLELCADELVVGGGVGWSYDRRRRRQRRQTGWESSETAHSLDRGFFLVLQRLATSPVISAGPLAPKTTIVRKACIFTVTVNMHALRTISQS